MNDLPLEGTSVDVLADVTSSARTLANVMGAQNRSLTDGSLMILVELLHLVVQAVARIVVVPATLAYKSVRR